MKPYKAYRNFEQILTLKKAFEKDGRFLKPEDLDCIEKGSVVFSPEEILWVGTDKDFPSQYEKETEQYFFEGKVLTPEIVDCHTHLVFGGNRSQEYSMRLNGADYQEIAKAGGGILNTMRGTQELSMEELFNIGVERIKRINSYGIGTIEIKSGYGLTFEKELEITRTIDRLKKYFSPKIQIKNTYMAAHAVPKEFQSSKDYMKKVVLPLLEKLAEENLIDAVDIFHEKNYFDEADTELLFEKSKSLGLDRKSHADEFFDNKGAILACKHKALSTDHLLMTGPDGIAALAESSTVATLLPGTGFFLGKPQAQARNFLDKGVKVAIASDFNPGSCHCDNVLLIASIAAPAYRMNLTELWASITINAAHALGLKNQGAITPGLTPRFSLFETPSVNSITYNWGRQLSSNALERA
jgi:imidazolonepropionase